MRPLELTIYEHNKYDEYDCPEWDYGVREIDAAELAEGKHFTEAEIAADYYRTAWLYECDVQDHDGYDGMRQTQILRQQANILERFATHPHFSDAD